MLLVFKDVHLLLDLEPLLLALVHLILMGDHLLLVIGELVLHHQQHVVIPVLIRDYLLEHFFVDLGQAVPNLVK